ncbi:DciA family protein [Hahella ganghwensis]|uniref:DciA family protein n=1 Tax=Hahella ganghwensis TaxID=286420 RepID=UPI000378DC4B|nr:DciA family protein [Hahella ganghwensis]
MRKQISDILSNSSSALGQLIDRASSLYQLQRRFSGVLPEDLKETVQFASVQNGRITVIVPNALSANLVRMRQHEILRDLRQFKEFEFVYQILPKVKPQVEKAKPKRQVNPVSKQNAELLMQEARHCDDEELRKVLESLASHTK